MPQLSEIIQHLEQLAPLSLQESYDNAGLITGQPSMEVKGILVCLDSTEEVMEEAIRNGCNVVVAHHPILFSGLKRLTGNHYTERVLIKAIRHDIAIYAIHTNLDNVLHGVNARFAAQLGLLHTRILSPMKGRLKKLVTFVPGAQLEAVRAALFEAGGGHIGNYSECSFSSGGTGSFKGEAGSQPFAGVAGIRHLEAEERLELIFPAWKEKDMLAALRGAHPYEEIAYDVYTLDNAFMSTGAGLYGELPEVMDGPAFLDFLKQKMNCAMIRHTKLLSGPIKKVAICGGSGSFLLQDAVRCGADIFISSDFKYHQFFDADGRIVLADIGHFESEQFTIDLLAEHLREKFTTFAVRLTETQTNPIYYR
ncbi:MAG: Nif3-like dinuclear metal center hexameric protein [Bacteroidia bacterium]|nr:Nif3-like dinuclear metal center hexameric protein [Bacteroidia bacterium]